MPGKLVCSWDDPDAKAALVSGLVNGARASIDVLDSVALDDGQADAVGLLALVANQYVHRYFTHTNRVAGRSTC